MMTFRKKHMKKKCTVTLLGLVLFALVFINSTKLDKTNETVSPITHHAIPAVDRTNPMPALTYTVHDSHANNSHFSRTNTKPCYSLTFLWMDYKLESKLPSKSMLAYFSTPIGNIAFIPQWQVNLRNAKKVDTYFLTAVVRLRLYPEDKAKWTANELKQWIHYQLWAGAEHVYICNHFLKATEKIEPHLRKYVDLGIVTIIPWNNITAVPNSKTYQDDNADNQISCYNHVLNSYGQHSEWQYNFDMDENPYVPGDYCEGFLSRFIRSAAQREPTIAELRVQNYVLQGQGDRTRDLHYDRINRISPRPYNGNVKPIYKTSLTTEAGMHGAKTQGKLVRPGPEQIKMLHYWGARKQNWGPDTQTMLRSTSVFNDVRDSLAVSVRHSLVTFGDYDAFSATTGP